LVLLDDEPPDVPELPPDEPLLPDVPELLPDAPELPPPELVPLLPIELVEPLWPVEP